MKVLLAIDGSASAYHAAEFLCRLPHDGTLEIEVLTVVNAPDVSTSTSTRAWLPQYMEQLHEAADEAYARVESCFEGSTSRLQQHKTTGHVGNAIVDRAAEIDASLIVIGAKGHSAASRMLLGSVSDFVGRHAPCGVMTVRPEDATARSDESLRVTVCYDDSDPSGKALAQFQAFSWSSGVDVQVVSVVHLFPQFPGEGEELLHEQVKHDMEAANKLLEKAVAELESKHVSAHAKVIKGDHAGEAIVEEAKANGSHLIVMGNTGRSLIPRLLLGSVSAFVQRHASQSVWIAR